MVMNVIGFGDLFESSTSLNSLHMYTHSQLIDIYTVVIYSVLILKI